MSAVLSDHFGETRMRTRTAAANCSEAARAGAAETGADGPLGPTKRMPGKRAVAYVETSLDDLVYSDSGEGSVASSGCFGGRAVASTNREGEREPETAAMQPI
jgi:hypothetical protein